MSLNKTHKKVKIRTTKFKHELKKNISKSQLWKNGS